MTAWFDHNSGSTPAINVVIMNVKIHPYNIFFLYIGKLALLVLFKLNYQCKNYVFTFCDSSFGSFFISSLTSKKSPYFLENNLCDTLSNYLIVRNGIFWFLPSILQTYLTIKCSPSTGCPCLTM